MYVVEDLRKGNVNSNGITINLDADINMMGANITINGNNYIIKNITSVDATYCGKIKMLMMEFIILQLYFL